MFVWTSLDICIQFFTLIFEKCIKTLFNGALKCTLSTTLTIFFNKILKKITTFLFDDSREKKKWLLVIVSANFFNSWLWINDHMVNLTTYIWWSNTYKTRERHSWKH